MQYTKLENLKSFLWITDSKRDQELKDRIEVMSEMLTVELGGSIEAWTFTRRYDGFGTPRITMESPVTSVSKIEVTKNNGYDWQEVELNFIDGYIVRAKDDLPRGNKCVRVTYTKGYDTVPSDLEQFFLNYVKTAIDSEASEHDEKDIKSEKIDGMTMVYFSPEEIAAKNKAFQANYDMIKNKYKLFNFYVG